MPWWLCTRQCPLHRTASQTLRALKATRRLIEPFTEGSSLTWFVMGPSNTFDRRDDGTVRGM